MTKTLYIPTTTLNFNNVLSSESISPKSFYERREYGYKTWYPIIENPLKNSIILYDAIPYINRPKSDYDDYPMVIAVGLSEEQSYNIKNKGNGIYQSDSSIYLNPWNTTFFFFSNTHIRIVKSKSESSAETKMTNLYSKRMYCVTPDKHYDISNITDTEFNNAAIEKDKSLNRIKGLLYGYYIGAALSKDERSISLLNILYEIRDIFSAIIASLNGIATNDQRKKLEGLFEELKKYSKRRTVISSIINNATFSSEEKISKIDALFDDINLRYQSYDLNWLLQQVQKEDHKNAINPGLGWIQDQILQFKNEFSINDKKLLSPTSQDLLLSNNKLTALSCPLIHNETEKELYRALINEVFSLDEFNGKTSSSKEELATTVTLKAREIYRDSWTECIAKQYLNDLRRHIGGASFNYEWKNDVLSSIAAVILKGDNWEGLLSFMQLKGMYDYRLAYGIYGTLNGFANMTRDFTDVILKEERTYVIDFYKCTFEKLFGYKIEDAPIPKYNKSESKQLKTEDNLQPNLISKIDNATDLGKKLRSTKSFLFILKELISIRTKIYKKLQDGLNESDDLVTKVEELISGFKSKRDEENVKAVHNALVLEQKIGDPEAFHNMLVKLVPKEDIRQKIYANFKNTQEELWGNDQTENDNKNKTKSIVNSAKAEHQYFYNDYNAWSVIEPLIQEKKALENLHNDLKWFQKVMHESQDEREYYKNVDERNDKDVIKRFCELKNGEDKNGKLKAPYFTQDLRELIKNKLLSKYCHE